MSLTPTDIAELVTALNRSGTSIPISMNSVTAVDPYQFNISVLITLIGSAIIIFWTFEMFGKPILSSIS